MSTATEQEVRDAVARVLGAAPSRLDQLSGGANNLVFRAEAGGRAVLAKAYFHHPGDPRDRLGVEFGMLDFLWHNGVRSVPQPMHADRERHIGIYEFIEGSRLQPGGVGWEDVQAMIDLLAAMWRLRVKPEAARLPAGSDAGFSIHHFLDNIGGRFAHSYEMLAMRGQREDVADFMRDRMKPIWESTKAFVEKGAKQFGLDIEELLPREKQTLNPADHGFHNALRGANGGLRFFDFEYAGWDDPVQMICNACLQPAVPMPDEYHARFMEGLLERIDGDRDLRARIRILYPLFALKWSLIMLNEFLPVAEERRRFAGTRPEKRLKEQLVKSGIRLTEASAYLDRPRFFDGLDPSPQ